MTEAEWYESRDPEAMLRSVKDTASERKLRLLGCACCRRIWGELVDERSRTGIEISERFADGGASEVELDAAKHSASDCCDDLEDRCLKTLPRQELDIAEKNWNAAEMAWKATVGWYDIYEITYGATMFSVDVVGLLRDLFDNAFRSITFDSRWQTSTVIDLARLIYDARNFDRMPILADALIDAGCDNEDVINHCRAADQHVRGCWLIDLLLGKK
jgi:hypothetical protein